MDIKNKYIVLSGNPSEGFQAFGPYDNFDDAADSDAAQQPFSWIMPLNKENFLDKNSN